MPESTEKPSLFTEVQKLIATTIVRQILLLGGGWLALRGITEDQARSFLHPVVEVIVGALLASLSAAWGVWASKISGHAREVANAAKQGVVTVQTTESTPPSVVNAISKVATPKESK
jgi:protein-S-isoprenylcysteine O-methyltransferase Ste14